ncbi:MAG: phage scaffolding protein [Pseudonocardia sp.]|nr:phage scaffolding protein [Pseudonocardia sp.]
MADEIDDLDQDVTEVDTGAEDEAEGQDDTDWTPPSKQDWANLKEALSKARKDARAAKRAAGEAPKADPDAKKPEDIEREAAQKVESRYKPIVVRQAARAAFAEAGLRNPETSLPRVLKLLELDEVDVSEDGDVDGLDEQIAEIKNEWPELFVQRRAPRVDGADQGSSGGRQKSSAEKITAAFMAGQR